MKTFLRLLEHLLLVRQGLSQRGKQREIVAGFGYAMGEQEKLFSGSDRQYYRASNTLRGVVCSPGTHANTLHLALWFCPATTTGSNRQVVCP